MEHFSIQLDETLREHMRARIAIDGFRDESDYLRTLVALDRDRADRLAAAIEEGLRSGISDRSVMEIFEDVRRQRLEAGAQ